MSKPYQVIAPKSYQRADMSFFRSITVEVAGGRHVTVNRPRAAFFSADETRITIQSYNRGETQRDVIDVIAAVTHDGRIDVPGSITIPII